MTLNVGDGEMTRFRSLGFTDFEVRMKLRERFQHDLHAKPRIDYCDPEQSALDDMTVLYFLLDTQIYSNAQYENFKARYEQELANGAQLPSFDEALERGWFRVLGGQIIVPTPMRDFVRNTDPPFETVFQELMRWSWSLTFTVSAIHLEGGNASLATQLQAADSDNFTIAVRTPAWVAARLWDNDPQPDLWQWVIKWRLLGAPDLTLGEAWDKTAQNEFSRLAINSVAQAGLMTWKDFAMPGRAMLLREKGDARGTVAEPMQDIPPHLLGKYLRLRWRPNGDEYDRAEDLLSPLWLVAVNLARRCMGSLLYPKTRHLAQLADSHPQVLEMLTDVVKQEPAFLADLLMHPKTAALATYLISVWQPNARTEEEAESVDREKRMAAFVDCVRAMGDYLSQDDVTAAEFAELLVALQAARYNAEPSAQESWERRITLIIELLGKGSPENQIAIVEHLTQRAHKGIGTPEFTIMLEAMSIISPIMAARFAKPLLETYRIAIMPGADVWNVETLSPKGAYALIRALLSLESEGIETLSNPVNVLDYLRTAQDESKRWQMMNKLAESLRAHIRILARAILVYNDGVPPELVTALARVIRTGAVSHVEKGKVAAFSGFIDNIRFRGRRQRSICLEITYAIARLDGADQKKIVDALLQVDEPGVLAELYQRLPAVFRPDIEKRIDEMVPEDAESISTLSELQQKIQQLLDAGLTEAAARFMSLEESFKTIGPNPGRSLERFRTQLHARLLKEQFDDILNAKLPEQLNQEDGKRAQDTLDFYRGLVLLQCLGKKDAAQAAAIFNRLYMKYKTTAYAINLLAARMCRILPTDIFVKLSGERAEQARYALEEASRALPPGSLNEESLAIHNTNVATLKLCLGRTAEARAALRLIDAAYLSPASIALEAVAMARDGFPTDGVLRLKHARVQFGMHPALEGAERHITEGAAYIATARVAEAEVLVETWRSVFGQFKNSDALQQAQVYAKRGVPPLEDWMTTLVRDALAAMANLTPAFRLGDTKHHEDAYNTLVREILRAQMSRWFGWAVVDQSLGGYTRTERWGERDFAIVQNNTELAVIEAMKFSTSGKGGIESHLKKVSAYSNCKLFFLVVYSHEDNPGNILKAIGEDIAPNPSSLRYKSMVNLDELGNQPNGIVARYEDVSGRPVTVVFLVVDLLQHGQKTVIDAPTVTATLAASGSASKTAACTAEDFS
jgi:hypothetical protein